MKLSDFEVLKKEQEAAIALKDGEVKELRDLIEQLQKNVRTDIF